MSTFWSATLILFQAHLKRTFFSKRALISAGLCCLPVAASLLIATISRFEGPPPLEVVLHMGWFLHVQTIVPLVALIVGSAVVAEEIEDRTITFLFTRPIPRAAILVGRYLAALVLLVVVLGASSALVIRILSGLHGAEGQEIVMPAGFQLRLFACVLLGGAVYSAVFAALGALVKRPVLVGIGYCFVFEGLLANLPGQNQKLTVLYYLKSLLLGGNAELLPMFSETLAPLELATPAAAVRTLVLILVAALAIGARRLASREYVLAA
ncbi:MAG: ABC transporter permease [Planctomycetes bacterium]|nr:ABC transporter permease [Planctomycetota bacterium]